MPLKISSNNKGTWITWEMPDESLSATFRIKPEMEDREVLATLVKATRFIAAQMGELEAEIQVLEAEIRGESASATSAPRTSAPVQPVDPSAPRVRMMPPASLSDAPAGGAPADTFGWASMPTTTVPEHLAQAWEIIPPGEA